jgi:hypothetical protein
MRKLQGIALAVSFALVALPAFAQNNGGGGGQNGQGGGGNGGRSYVPAPLAGVGLPVFLVGGIGYLIYRRKQRSK